MKYTAKKLQHGMYYYRGLVIEKFVPDSGAIYWSIGDTVDCFGTPKKPEEFADYFSVEWHDSTNTLSDAKQLVDDIYFNNEGERI